MFRYKKERNELRADLSAEVKESSVKENVKQNVTKIIKMKENVTEKNENVCEPVIQQLSVGAPDLDQPLKDHYECDWADQPLKDHYECDWADQPLKDHYECDWEISIAEAENVEKVPFNVYEKTPEKPLSHPSNCNQQ